MDISVKVENSVSYINPVGKIDYSNAKDLEKIIEDNAKISEKMILDMQKVDYMSSAGLRSILFADNLMSEKQGLVLKNVNMSLMEILTISGFKNVLNIE